MLTPAQGKINLPEDFEGDTTRQKVEEINSDQPTHLSQDKLIAMTLETTNYIMTKYTAEEVASDDFIDTLRTIFPNATETELQNRHYFLRNAYTTYEFIREKYNEYIKTRLASDAYRRVHSDSDFDWPNEVPYVEAPEGQFAKIYNFKKFLTYSHNPDERRAISRYLDAKKNGKDFISRIDYIYDKIDWKKVWFYGTIYENPLLSKLGVSEIQNGKEFTVRLISRNTYIENRQELDFGFLIQNKEFTFILANNLSEKQQKPQIDLTGSENVAEYTVLYPAPLMAENIPFAHKYFGNFLLPFKVKPIDPSQPVKLKAAIKITACSNFFVCTTEDFTFHMTLEPSGDDFFDNGYDNIFAQTLQHIPQADVPQLKLLRFAVDTVENNNQVLRLEFKSTKKVKNFKVFIEETDSYTQFESPFINLQDDKIYVRFEPYPDHKTEDFTNSEFMVTAVLNNEYYYRNKLIARPASEFDPQKPTLNFGLILLAILGGFILNFMPCVFPVLSLKIIAMKQAQKLRKKEWKQTLYSTIAGIFSGFTVLIVMLLFAKYLGYSLGWGMQFQNMGFLVAMTFVLSCFIVLMPYLSFDSLSKLSTQKKGSKTNFLIGNLIVLLSTPCTGPYLATAIGFALSGTYLDIISILYAVALGLSLPYIFMLKLKDPKNFLPKPGKWMTYLYGFTKLMLYLTIFWFFTLILGQTDWICLVKILVLLFFFLGLFFLYRRVLDQLDRIHDAPAAILRKIRRGAHIVMAVIFVLTTGLSAYIADKAYQISYQHNMDSYEKDIDLTAIQGFLNKGHPVLVEIRADWCMTCQANNVFIFHRFNLQRWEELYNLKFIQVDWTNYNEKILNYMSRYGRKGLPFYILYTPYMREGMVLPEIFTNEELEQFLLEGKRR